MLDTVGGEIQKWVERLKEEAIKCGSERLATEIVELEFWVLFALSRGIAFSEDSGVAEHLLSTEYPEDYEKWKDEARSFMQKVKDGKKNNYDNA